MCLGFDPDEVGGGGELEGEGIGGGEGGGVFPASREGKGFVTGWVKLRGRMGEEEGDSRTQRGEYGLPTGGFGRGRGG